MSKQPLIVICGPTASGKTALSIAIAKALGCEVVSADSMQIYRGMDIGTAKPGMDERDGIVHHMFDVAEPWENYSVSRYAEDATRVIDDIISRGKLPVVVGGTGMYIDSLLRSGGFAEFDEKLREKLMAKSAEELLEELNKVDSESADRLHLNDKKRICRALEIFYLTGKTIGEHNIETQKAPPRYDACMIGLTCSDRQILYERIEKRVDEMIENGLIEEIKGLQNAGISRDATSMQAIGYKELFSAVSGDEPLEDAIARLKQSTRRLAKRQLTWFRRDTKIKWFCLDDSDKFEDVLQASCSFVKNCGV